VLLPAGRLPNRVLCKCIGVTSKRLSPAPLAGPRVPRLAIEPPESRWAFPAEPPAQTGRSRSVAAPNPTGVQEAVGVGADLEPGTLLRAYRTGVFPMPAGRGTLAWWAPDPRGILPLDGLKVSRSLRRSCRRYTITLDLDFEAVITACADLRRRGAWIDEPLRCAYLRLHELGWAHSIEAWDAEGVLAGGLYGVAIGGLFAGESMFHHQTDASKVALVGLVDLLIDAGSCLLDVQWATDHLTSLGVVEVPRGKYLEMLKYAVSLPQPAIFGG